MAVLAIESSFDDTGLAVVENDFTVTFSLLSSSVNLHAPYGGIIPELASRDHLKNLPIALNKLIQQHKNILDNLDALGVTMGPGLPGCLLAGVNFARGIAYALSKPLYGLNHLEGHLFSPFFGTHLKEIPFPFIGLIITGGNTVLYLARNFNECVLLGQTLDDAVGELFDKVAFKLNLGYPGGKRLEEEAKKVIGSSVPKEFSLPVPMKHSGDLNFSFSGLKTAALKLIQRQDILRYPEKIPYLAYSLQVSAWESLWIKLTHALALTGVRVISISGGVSLNQFFRDYVTERALSKSLKVTFPKPNLCMDNAEMMAYLLILRMENNEPPQDFDIDANLI